MTGTVFIVDDDHGVRDSLSRLLEADSLQVRAFASAEEFLEACDPREPGCVVLDVRLPGATGPEVQERLAERGATWPIIFLTGYGDVPTTVTALKLDDAQRAKSAARGEVHARFEQLTPREQEVMALVATGTSNKEIARQLKISHRTVETHRARVMRKMGAASLLQLARMVESVRPRA